jgi:hypothetical protein
MINSLVGKNVVQGGGGGGKWSDRVWLRLPRIRDRGDFNLGQVRLYEEGCGVKERGTTKWKMV